jgi:DNA-binding NarL/FixJ family response regulator
MSKSQRLRLDDVRAVFRLLGECGELGADSYSWRRHMLVELCRMTGSLVGIAGEAEKGARGILCPSELPMEVGWASEAARQRFLQYLALDAHQRDETSVRATLAFTQSSTEVLTQLRSELVDAQTWYTSVDFNEYRRVSELDDHLYSAAAMPQAGMAHMITLHAALREPPLPRRAVRLVDLFHQELVALLGSKLARTGEPGIERLSPRLRQVLGKLLSGDSEKQIARALELSLATVHQYVMGLHKHFGVSSRGELMALFLRRHIGSPEQWVGRFDGSPPRSNRTSQT